MLTRWGPPLLQLLVSVSASGWHLCIERRPNCNPPSAQGPSALQSASIRNPPRVQRNIASGVRT
eukprot:1938641-Alexandrium_andersonii.AAC.1